MKFFINERRLCYKRKRWAQVVDVPDKPTKKLVDRIGSELVPNADSPSSTKWSELFDVPEEGDESFWDKINRA